MNELQLMQRFNEIDNFYFAKVVLPIVIILMTMRVEGGKSLLLLHF